MRGKRSRSVSGLFRCRIIPAHAGQTPAMPHRAGSSPDHPRACGANMVTLFAETTVIGSSPRMRGKLPSTSMSVPPSTDHPRACGANAAVRRSFMIPSGSSPRMRGKQSDFMRKLLSAGPSIIGFAQWLQSSYYCSCLQSSAKTPISRGTTPTSLFLGFQNSITLLLLT